MECKSIQSISSSSTTRRYDVFVSFRGKDTRNNFTDHLFGAFQRRGIVAFKDDINIKQGELISTELIQAIEGSRVLVVVFSKNYANSSWCLQELAKIADCMKVIGSSVLPVFYDVSPSEVRKQTGDYGKAFAKHEERFKHDLGMVKRWREALEQVANLSGWDVQNKPQYGEAEKIAESVENILGYKLSSLDTGLVGLPPRVEHLEKVLASYSNNDVRVVGVCGMGGIGKTTLAREVYGRNFHQYDAYCFIDDISKVYDNGGSIATQKQLMCQTLKKHQEIHSIFEANDLIRTRLRRYKSFIVLDNVDKVKQLKELGMNRDCLGAGSRVMIISRDRHILNEYGVDEVYNAELLNMDEARQLFYLKAFKHDYIMSDHSREYEKLTDLALKYCQGLPLAIEVLGSFLYGRNISTWRSALARLRDNPEKDIMNVLRISFDGFEQEEKEIFLDIACFFNNYYFKEFVKQVLDCCGYHSDIGLEVLIDKSLLSATNPYIEMHDMLRELGMEIVRQNARNEPWKWSRIWCKEDFNRIMPTTMAMDSVEAIRIEKDTTLRAEVLSRLNRLRLLLILGYVKLSGNLTCLSNELRYLKWCNCPLTCFPSSCELSKLVQLHLPKSNIKKLWKGIKALDNLKILNLECSKNLVKIPDLRLAPNLEQLNLEGCTKLVDIHPSIGHLKQLAYLNLKNCTSLQSLPICIFSVRSLEVVNLRGCSKLFHSKLLENARHDTSDDAIQCQSAPSFFERLKLMWPLHLFNSRRNNDIGGSVMPSSGHFHKLRELDLSYCNLVNIPKAMALLSCLEVLNLRGNNFVELPCINKELPRLIILNLDHCKQLTFLSEFPLRTDLHLQVRKEPVSNMCEEARAGLHIFNCPKLLGMESWSNIALSWMKQLLKVHKGSSPPIGIIIPGTQIPDWFNNQSVGHSIRGAPFPDVHDSNWIGLAFCAAFVAHYDPPYLNHAKLFAWSIFFGLSIPGNALQHRVVELAVPNAGVESSVHLYLVYFTRQELIHLCRFKRGGDADHFDAHMVPLGFDTPGQTSWSDFYVKRWGFRTVFKEDLEEHNNDK